MLSSSEQWVLGITLFVLAYPFTLYPVLLWAAAKLRPRRWKIGADLPMVSVIISAYNEERAIEDKIRNVLAFDYPEGKWEIIVASDGSTDRTDAIVSSFGDRVRLLRTGTRVGKQVAVNLAEKAARGEVLVLTDVGLLSESSTLRRLVRHFGDPTIGAVSCSAAIPKAFDAGAPVDNGEGLYFGLDARMRIWESRVDSTTGCCGILYAVRRSAHRPFSPSVASDLSSALDVVQQGLRAVVDEELFGYSRSARSYGTEFRRKVRTIVGGMDALWTSKVLWWGLRHPFFFWSLWSHKITRWLSPVAALAALGIVFVGAWRGDPALQALALIMSAGIVAGLLGTTLPAALVARLPLRLFGFALVSWLAGIVAWWEFFRGKKYVTWGPTHRERITAPVEESLRAQAGRRQ